MPRHGAQPSPNERLQLHTKRRMQTELFSPQGPHGSFSVSISFLFPPEGYDPTKAGASYSPCPVSISSVTGRFESKPTGHRDSYSPPRKTVARFPAYKTCVSEKTKRSSGRGVRLHLASVLRAHLQWNLSPNKTQRHNIRTSIVRALSALNQNVHYI